MRVMVLLLRLIVPGGGDRRTFLTLESESEVKQNQSKHNITFNTPLKTVL